MYSVQRTYREAEKDMSNVGRQRQAEQEQREAAGAEPAVPDGRHHGHFPEIWQF